MLKDKDNSSQSAYGGAHNISDQNLDNPLQKNGFFEKGIHFLRESHIFHDAPSKTGNSGPQELTLSYLCDNSKLNSPEKEIPGKNLLNSFEKLSYKGKEVVSEDQNPDDCRWVERDFLQLNEISESSLKRDVEDGQLERENRDKRPKIETLDLSLALPDVSLSLTALNPTQSSNPQTTYSNDFTAASLSYSYSHQFSHNPSCSLTRNSTDNYEYSVGSNRRDCDQIWNCGEGTNGSVHSRFRPVGDGVALSNHGGGGFTLMQSRLISKDLSNSLYRTTSSDNLSFFPSELPARPVVDTHSGDSRGRGSEQLGARKLSRPERILREIVSESIPFMTQVFQELTDETIEATKEYLKQLIITPEKRDELVGLQSRLERRSDLINETLSKSNKNQLEILVAIKMGLASFLSGKNHIPTAELLEIFLLERCRNVNCKRLLPVDDCDCKICSTKKGFCSECMCPVCLNFDCASNTCSWVGCDVCSHWCHADCGTKRNLIKPGPSLKGAVGTTEMQFHCLGCGHASEMFGFVKDVFMACAKSWGVETLIKELDCVRKVFHGSEDFKGKELHEKADEMISKLENNVMSASDVCSFIFQFFNYADSMSEFPVTTVPSKHNTAIRPSIRGKDDTAPLPPSTSLPPKPSFHSTGSSSGRCVMSPHDLHQNDLKASTMSEKVIEDEWSVKLPKKKESFDSLESVVRIKEAEARMFQSRANEARREAEEFRRMVKKLEEEYSEKTGKRCLQETEERKRKRKKLDELKSLEDSHCDYYKMKMRMQAEIAGLLERMESTKQLWV